jgi:hypothetical protein
VSVVQLVGVLLAVAVMLAIAIGVPVALRSRGLAFDIARRYPGSPWFGSRRNPALALALDALPPSFRVVATPEALVLDSETAASRIPWSEVTGIGLGRAGQPPVLLVSLGDRPLPFLIERGRRNPAELVEQFTARWLAARRG